jgi:hypothetical protein
VSAVKKALHKYNEDEREQFTAWRDRQLAAGLTFHKPKRTRGQDGAHYTVDTYISFSNRPCSKCSRTGLVPDHHRFLCIPCYV